MLASITLASLIAANPPSGLKGALFGHPFPIVSVKVEKFPSPASAKSGGKVDTADVYSVTFADSNEFMPERELKFHLYLDRGTKFAKFRIDQLATEFGSEAYFKARFGSGSVSVGRGAVAAFLNYKVGAKSQIDTAMDMIAFKLTTVKQPTGRFLAQIDARVPKFRSFVAGQFEFVPTSM